MSYTRLLQLPRAKRLLACAFMLMVVAALGGLPGSYRPDSAAGEWAYFTNFLHQPLYAGVGLSFMLAFRRSCNSVQDWALAVALGLLVGVFDEIHQHFVLERSSSLWDLGSDGYGAFCAAYGAHLSQTPGWLKQKLPQLVLLAGLGLAWNYVPSFSAETPLPFLR